jgi:hypothetical protein
MLPHQQRVVDEKIDLDAKIEKLMTFLTTSVFDGLDNGEKSRLRIQLDAMGTYSTVLGERIAHFG